jgi:hypothetical protein
MSSTGARTEDRKHGQHRCCYPDKQSGMWSLYSLIIGTELFPLKIADWVAESVLNKEDARKRANIVKHLIGVADVSLLLLFLFSYIMMVLLALSNNEQFFHNDRYHLRTQYSSDTSTQTNLGAGQPKMYGPVWSM